MNEFLAHMYGTGQTKEASEMNNEELLEAFCKQAAAEDINLNQLNDAQVEQLFGVYVSKIAEASEEEEEEKKEKDKEEKKAYAAYTEFAQMKEAQDKLAEADFIGRQIAHACVDELRKIAADGEKVAGEPSRTVAAVGKKLKGIGADIVADAHTRAAPTLKQLNNKIDDLGRSTRKSLDAEDLGDKAREAFNKTKGWAKEHKRELAIGGGVGAAGAAAGALASRNKKSSAFDEEAAVYGLKLANAYNFDPEVIGERLDALFTLGAQTDLDNSKVAAANSYEQGLHIRGLELLEQVGVPIDWNSLCGE